MESEAAARMLAELGNTTRLEIFRLLVRAGPDGLPVGEIQDHLEIPGSTLSHHVSRLVWAGLVTQERQGRTLICRPRHDQLERVIDFLQAECCGGVGAVRRPAGKRRAGQ